MFFFFVSLPSHLLIRSFVEDVSCVRRFCIILFFLCIICLMKHAEHDRSPKKHERPPRSGRCPLIDRETSGGRVSVPTVARRYPFRTGDAKCRRRRERRKRRDRSCDAADLPPKDPGRRRGPVRVFRRSEEDEGERKSGTGKGVICQFGSRQTKEQGNPRALL